MSLIIIFKHWESFQEQWQEEIGGFTIVHSDELRMVPCPTESECLWNDLMQFEAVLMILLEAKKYEIIILG